MAAETKLPVSKKTPSEPPFNRLHPFEMLRREVEQLFNDFDGDFWRRPFSQFPALAQGLPRALITAPAVDVTESEKAYEISVELPGMDQKDIQVALVNGGISIKGEKREEIKDEKVDHYVSERSYGSFERYFTLPEGVDTDKIDATFKNGVLHLMLPKTVEAQKTTKTIEVKGP